MTWNFLLMLYITMASYWAQCRLESSAYPLFAPLLVHSQIKENNKSPYHWPFVRGIHRWPVNSPHKRQITQKMFPFGDVLMNYFQYISVTFAWSDPARTWIHITGRDRLRLTALTTNHHGGGAKRRSCTFVVYRETRQRQHTWSRTDIVVHAVQPMWGIIWNFTTELLCIKAVKISAGSS